ncbi:MAG: glycoside hydrolase family 3 C-terminal domain-containing protein [Clostridiales bacterium]|nr:glycoside hydrolase family 3 C-terminal domain-containing protein [Clostridiales bacterium]
MEIDEIIGAMSLRQKADLLTGKDFWQTVDYPELGVPSIFLSDGPHGLRRQAAKADHLGLNASIPATCFPTAATMANSWNEDLGERLGEALGIEAASQDVNVVLGPGTCMKRNPRCGRNFEYFSEDPYLAGKMSAAYIRGIQQNGTAACVKHFAANNQELRRMVSDSVIDKRTLREIYLTAFEIAVKEGKTKSIMTSYNRINGVHADENEHLLRDILRGEWEFDGVVISDWAGTNNKVKSTIAGSDLEMPSCKYGADDIVKAVENGELDIKYVDESVKRVLTLVEQTSAGEKGKPFDTDAHHELAQACAEESIVLLKNDGILPLKSSVKVAIIGDFAKSPRYQGAGSSVVNPTKLTALLDSQDDLSFVGYEKGFDRYGKKKNGLIKKAVKLARNADAVILCLGLDEVSEAEGLDRDNIRMPENQIELYKNIRNNNANVIVVLSCGSAVELDFLSDANAIVYGCLSGQAGAKAVMNVLTGKVNPSGKLAETFPVKYDDCPSASHFPGEQMTVEYREGLYIGYRYYDTANVPVAYPFGYGLSYTTFEYSDISADQNGVTFSITNTGDYDGSEIAQLYVGKIDGKVFRPTKELKGFKKVFIKKGESVTVTIPFDDKTFRYFNVATNRWEIESGKYQLYIGASSADIRLSSSVDKQGTTNEIPYDIGSLPSYYSGKVSNVSDEEFKTLIGRDIPKAGYDFYKKKRMVIHENCTVADLRYSKRWVGRAFSGVIRFVIAFLRGIGKRTTANTLVMGVLHQPVRGLAKFGGMTRRKMEGLLLMFNGHFFKGVHTFFSKEKVKKVK